jgi:DNA-binding transcriptional MerR regulator
MKNASPSYYNIETLARLTGLTRRTVRYYVQRGLIPKPEGGGRGHYYTDEHLRLIEMIKIWQKQGVPLEKMRVLIRQGTQPDHAEVAYEIESTTASQVTTDRWITVRFGGSVELSCRPGALSEEDLRDIENVIISKLMAP